MNTYDLFTGEELEIAELIQQRRLQMLVHSLIYYDLNHNIISDKTWQEWAWELRDLQQSYPEIEKKVPYREGFENWDGSTGAFLPYKSETIQRIAFKLTHLDANSKAKKTQKNGRRRLF